MPENTCCFFGHRKAMLTDKQKTRLSQTIENLISQEKVDAFLFGSKSDFNKLCYETVCELKKNYSHIRRIYISVYPPSVYDTGSSVYPRGYEETYYPEHIRNAGRATYVERNYEMIEQSKFCIVYFDEDYKAPKSKRKSIYLLDFQTKSGTKVAYDYACKKQRTIINIVTLDKQK